MRKGPQDLPYVPWLLVALSLLFAILDDQQRQLAYEQLAQPAAGAAVRTAAPTWGLTLYAWASQLAIPWLLLRIAGKPERYVQTALASLIVSSVATLLAIPLVATLGPIPAQADQLSPGQALIAWLSLFLMIWQLLLQAHVFRHALDVSLRRSLFIVIGLMALEICVSVLLFGMQRSGA